MHQSSGKRIVFTILFLSAASLVLNLPGPIKVFFGFIQAYYLPGFVFLLFLGYRGRSNLDNVFIPLLLSPVIMVLFFLSVHSFTRSFDSALNLSLIILYLLLVMALATGRFRIEGEISTVPNTIFLISFAFCGIIIASYLVNDFLFYHDTCRHSSIANEILYRGLPPMEPFFVDIPIRSMWFQHLFQAIWYRLSGLSIFHSMWLVNLISAFTFPYLIARITSLFTNKRKLILATPLFAIAGLEAAGWILWPLNLGRAFFGDIRGAEEIARILNGIVLNNRFVVSILAPPGTYPLNILDKYLTIDIHHYSLNLFLLCFIMAATFDFQKRSPAKAAVNILLIMTGAWLFRIVNGIALVLTAVLAGFFVFLSGRIKKEREKLTYQSFVIPVLAAAVIIMGLFQYRNLTGDFIDGLFVPNRISFNLINLLTIIAPLIVLIPFVLPALRKVFVSSSREYRVLASWIVSLTVISIVMDVGGTLESYFILPLFLLLIGPVTWKIIKRIEQAEGVKRVFLSTWVVILFVVPPVLTVRGYMLEKPRSKHVMRRYRIAESEHQLYNWIHENTKIDAVIIEKNEYNVMPYYAYRRNFYMTSWEILNFGYKGEKVERYKEIRDEIYAGGAITAKTIKTLRNFDFDIYVVVWSEDLVDGPDLREKFLSYNNIFEEVFENPAGKIYLLKN